MKKLFSVLMVLAMLFSFAAADSVVTPTDLQPETEQPAAVVPVVSPKADERESGNFRDYAGETTLALGTYTQLGELPLQIWIPNGLFTEQEIPQDDEEYADTIMILAYNSNPEYTVTIDCAEAAQTYEELLAQLASPEFADIASEVSPAIANGFDAVAFTVAGEGDSSTRIMDFFMEDRYVQFSFPVVEDAVFVQFASMMSASLEAME